MQTVMLESRLGQELKSPEGLGPERLSLPAAYCLLPAHSIQDLRGRKAPKGVSSQRLGKMG